MGSAAKKQKVLLTNRFLCEHNEWRTNYGYGITIIITLAKAVAVIILAVLKS